MTTVLQGTRRTTLVRALCGFCVGCGLTMAIVLSAQMSPLVPTYKVEPFWPKPLPNHWILDHVWITHRPSTLQPNETRSIWMAAPPAGVARQAARQQLTSLRREIELVRC